MGFKDKSHKSDDLCWFANTLVLITGATSGIGRAMARVLVEAGAAVILHGRRSIDMESLKAELAAGPGQVRDDYLVDLSAPGSALELCRCVQGNHQVDIVINNAGFGHCGDYGEMPQDLLNGMTMVNMQAVADICRAFVPGFRQKRAGGILNVGSVASFFPTPGSALYGATKHFVAGLTDALHEELRPFGVHVTGLYPGRTHTRFIERASGGSISGWDQAMSAQEVAYAGLMGLAQNRVRVIPQIPNQLKVLLARVLPVRMLLQATSASRPRAEKGQPHE